jgi:hypothetical protein
MLDPKTIGSWVGALVVAGGAFAGVVKFLFWVFDEVKKRRTHDGFAAPKSSLRLAAKSEGSCWWHMGRMGDDPTMQVVGRMFVTNIASVPVRIPQAELRYGFLGRKRVSGMVRVSRGLDENMYGMYDIAPNETRNLSCDFWVYPPVVEPSEPFTAHSVQFFDQFGNAHKVKRLRFASTHVDPAGLHKEPEEFPYEINDPVEKEVVSVLKAELGRYQMCGRQAGGLGSVHIVYQGRSFTGTGSDSWTPNSPMNQLIVTDPESATLKSDNPEALIAFYRRLGSEREKERFAAVLIDRLDSKKGYLAISYFIVCVLLSVGFLADALRKAKRDLPDGEARVFGLSNVLMLLNGLLRYRHPDFTNEMLDEIERTIHGLKEHPFLIPAKIAAIRAARLAKA